MSLLKLLFSFQGRIGRGAFAGGYVLGWVLAIAIVAAMVYSVPGGEKPPGPLVALLALLVLFLAWSQFAVAAKRFHDLGTTGWACLLLVIPLVGLIGFIYLLCARGEEHDNQYGAAVRAPLADAGGAW